MDNIPIYGCESCRTTAGRMGCTIHTSYPIMIKRNIITQPKDDDYGHAICPKHKEEFFCPECMEEIGSLASNLMYKDLLK